MCWVSTANEVLKEHFWTLWCCLESNKDQKWKKYKKHFNCRWSYYFSLNFLRVKKPNMQASDLLFNIYKLLLMKIKASQCPQRLSLCIELHPLKCPDREPHISINMCTVTQIKYMRKGRTFLSIWYFKAVDLTSSFGKRIKNYSRITVIHCLQSNVV